MLHQIAIPHGTERDVTLGAVHSMRKICAYLLLLQLGSGLALAYADPPPSIEVIVTRMAEARAANRASLRAHSLTREYTLVGKDKKPKATVIAQISFAPPGAKKFTITKATGTGFGERAVRQMLENETAIVKNFDSTDMSLANYGFRLVREEQMGGKPCFVLELTPKRKDKTLLRGHVWVDSSTYLLLRTEGVPAKEPSWWLRESGIVFTYGDVGGMWLQTGSESRANVRFVGQYTMVSRDVDYTLSEAAGSGKGLTPAGQ
jgi:hypothetical protein